MILSFNQPSFIPWPGFFARLMASDKMVLLDNTLFAQGFTFVNRNRIKSPEGELWITVPIKRKGLGRQKIKDLVIYQTQYWAKKFLLTLQHCYKKSISFNKIYNPIFEILNKQDNNFLNMAFPILNHLKTSFNIKNEFILQTSTGIESSGTDLLLEIAIHLKATEVLLPYPAQNLIEWKNFIKKGIKVKFLKFFSPVYPQFWGRFVGNLSALDLLFCMGKESHKFIEISYILKPAL